MAGGPTPYDAAVQARKEAEDEVHRLHKMVHTLRRLLLDESQKSGYDEEGWTEAEISMRAGVEPECAACHGFGAGSGQQPVPIKLQVVDALMLGNIHPDELTEMLDRLGGRLIEFGFKVV